MPLKRLEAFKMWCWRRMERVNWKEKKTNKELLDIMNENSSVLTIIENRRGKVFSHLIKVEGLEDQEDHGKHS